MAGAISQRLLQASPPVFKRKKSSWGVDSKPCLEM